MIKNLFLAYGATFLLGAGLGWGITLAANRQDLVGIYSAACILGALFGLTELVSRYRDEPVRALWSWAALLYILINALASAFALNLIRVFGWLDEPGAIGMQTLYKEVLLAAFGAMALFRSSLFIVRLGNADVGFGPVFILQILLGATDRAVDRQRGQSRSSEVSNIMAEVSFEKAKEILPSYCLALMQNLPKEEQESLAQVVATISTTSISDATIANRQKAVLLGLALMNVIGTDLLEQAVKSLGDDIKIDSRAAAALPGNVTPA